MFLARVHASTNGNVESGKAMVTDLVSACIVPLFQVRL
jgi:hypothetical protein